MTVVKHSLLVAAAGVGLAIPQASLACSKGGFPARRAPNVAHFIAIPTGDTVSAGPGNVRYTIGPGHSGPAGDRPIFGQVVSVERLGGLAARSLGSGQRVVLVPWDYREDCTPTPWTLSASWAERGTRGLFTGVLRDSSQWADGIPTFDVFEPELQPYPQRLARQRRGRTPPSDSLVPMEELFDLIELYPDQRFIRDSAEVATAPLFAWARANPTLTGRYPIADVLDGARYAVAHQRLRRIQSPLTGTYQLTVSLSDGTARTFYARTRGRPITEWHAYGRRRDDLSDPTFVPRPDGYNLLAAVSPFLAALPKSCDRERGPEAYMAVADPPWDSIPRTRTWAGALEVNLAARAFPDDPVLDRFARDDFEAYSRRSRAALPVATPATFTRRPDGSIRVEQTSTLDDGRSLTISGTRISDDVIACAW